MESTSSRDDAAKELLKELYRDLQTQGVSPRISEVPGFLTDDVAPSWRASLANILVHHHFRSGDYLQALEYCQKWLVWAPDDSTAVNSLLSILTRLKRWNEIVAEATARLAQHPKDFRLHSAICQALGTLGRLNEARAYGTLCLALKDETAKSEAIAPSDLDVPASATHRSTNVISFSLFGTREIYLQGAVTNVRAARFVYPGWTCRFYLDDSVPLRTKQLLTAEGADLRKVDGLPSVKYGTFWRFLVADDPSVGRYLVRDCDAIVNVRERVAVDEWIASQRRFHVMRDSYTHTELVLAGMWGGIGGALPPMGDAFIRFVESTISHRTLDQEFLREKCWPIMRQSLLAHDSQFAFGERRDFPAVGRLPTGQHVGDAIPPRH